MGREQDHVIEALLEATKAPGAVPKLAALGMSDEAARQIIRHLSQIPAFERGLSARMDVSYAETLLPLDIERLVLLHIPKCGGTTLHNMLVGWYGAAALHRERHNNLYFYSARDLASKRLFSGHYDYVSTRLVPGRKKLITFLRDPRSRLISLYNFHRSHRDDVIERHQLTLARWANMYDIDAYFADPKVRAHPAVNNSLARYLSDQPQLGRHAGDVTRSAVPVETLAAQAKANLAQFDFIGFMEEYDRSIAQLAGLLGYSLPDRIEQARKFEDLIATDPNMKRIEKQTATEETHRLIDDLVCHDEAVYDHARSLVSSI